MISCKASKEEEKTGDIVNELTITGHHMDTENESKMISSP
jgi:hypothetical protein